MTRVGLERRTKKENGRHWIVCNHWSVWDLCVYVCVIVCVCVCDCVCMCVWLCVRVWLCVCVCLCMNERVRMCLRERMRKTKSERVRKRERDRKREKWESHRERREKDVEREWERWREKIGLWDRSSDIDRSTHIQIDKPSVNQTGRQTVTPHVSFNHNRHQSPELSRCQLNLKTP